MGQSDGEEKREENILNSKIRVQKHKNIDRIKKKIGSNKKVGERVEGLAGEH